MKIKRHLEAVSIKKGVAWAYSDTGKYIEIIYNPKGIDKPIHLFLNKKFLEKFIEPTQEKKRGVSK